DETMKSPPVWIPSKLIFSNFTDAVTKGVDELGFYPFLVYGRNTLLITILTVSGAVFANSLVAYAFARLKWPGRDAFFSLTLATM
ncbi:carbohydrate ABC transporter permease, partial [Enterococcus faecium]